MYRMTILFSFLAVSGCSAMPDCRTIHDPVIQVNTDVINSLANELQREHIAGTFDGLVLVAKDNTVLLKQAYGCADQQNSIENNDTAISDMGSIAKTFTAAAVLQLAANGRLQLTNTIKDFYPNAPEAVRPITIEQLLAHSSGMDNFHNDSDFEVMDRSEAERRILSMPLIAKPGEKVSYSNAAYTLLAAIVEQVSGQTFREYVHENILRPLKLDNTGFYQDTHISASNLARGYGGDEPGSTTFEKGLTWALVGAGGMVTSIDDLANWFAALKKGTIFPEGATNQVFTESNERWLLGSFALVEISGDSVIQMGGSTDYGYTALIQFVPNRDYLIVLLLNAHDSKYKNATHHRLSRNHILPILFRKGEVLPNN